MCWSGPHPSAPHPAKVILVVVLEPKRPRAFRAFGIQIPSLPCGTRLCREQGRAVALVTDYSILGFMRCFSYRNLVILHTFFLFIFVSLFPLEGSVRHTKMMAWWMWSAGVVKRLTAAGDLCTGTKEKRGVSARITRWVCMSCFCFIVRCYPCAHVHGKTSGELSIFHFSSTIFVIFFLS